MARLTKPDALGGAYVIKKHRTKVYRLEWKPKKTPHTAIVVGGRYPYVNFERPAGDNELTSVTLREIRIILRRMEALRDRD